MTDDEAEWHEWRIKENFKLDKFQHKTTNTAEFDGWVASLNVEERNDKGDETTDPRVEPVDLGTQAKTKTP